MTIAAVPSTKIVSIITLTHSESEDILTLGQSGLPGRSGGGL